jgi:hypothetical protein
LRTLEKLICVCEKEGGGWREERDRGANLRRKSKKDVL